VRQDAPRQVGVVARQTVELAHQQGAEGEDHLLGRGSLRARAWSGWLVAAVVALAAMAGRFVPQAPQGPSATLAAGLTPDEAFNTYLDLGKKEGSVVGELPTRVIVSSQEAPSGEGYELICLRQIVVKQNVPDLYEFAGTDEKGQPTLVKFQPQPEVPDH